jgi:hypothetical protein
MIKHNQPILAVQMTENQGSSNDDTAVDGHQTIAKVRRRAKAESIPRDLSAPMSLGVEPAT